MLHELLIRLRLEIYHLIYNRPSLLPSHLLDHTALDLVLWHVGHLQDQVRILQVLANRLHFLDNGVDAMALQ